MTNPPEEVAWKRCRLIAGVSFVAKTSNADHMSATEVNDCVAVMSPPGQSVGTSDGYWLPATPRTMSLPWGRPA